MALPGPSLEVIGGPLAYAEQAFADGAYSVGSIPFARTEEAQKAHAATLMGRELEAACVATFIFSQPIGEQAELADLPPKAA